MLIKNLFHPVRGDGIDAAVTETYDDLMADAYAALPEDIRAQYVLVHAELAGARKVTHAEAKLRYSRWVRVNREKALAHLAPTSYPWLVLPDNQQVLGISLEDYGRASLAVLETATLGQRQGIDKIFFIDLRHQQMAYFASIRRKDLVHRAWPQDYLPQGNISYSLQ